jgi:hypothetical protein
MIDFGAALRACIRKPEGLHILLGNGRCYKDGLRDAELLLGIPRPFKFFVAGRVDRGARNGGQAGSALLAAASMARL